LSGADIEPDGHDHWHFYPISNPRAHEEVVEQITFAILSGAFHTGERLPNVEALSKTMGVSKPVIGEALKVLTKAGVVRAQRGVHGGLTVDNVDVPDSVLALTAPLRHFEIREIVEARRPVEMQLALLAGERAIEDDFASMQVCIDRLLSTATATSPTASASTTSSTTRSGGRRGSRALALYQHQILENLYAGCATTSPTSRT
jgi:DNA-binding FadR family transcriptional regulator